MDSGKQTTAIEFVPSKPWITQASGGAPTLARPVSNPWIRELLAPGAHYDCMGTLECMPLEISGDPLQ